MWPFLCRGFWRNPAFKAREISFHTVPHCAAVKYPLFLFPRTFPRQAGHGWYLKINSGRGKIVNECNWNESQPSIQMEVSKPGCCSLDIQECRKIQNSVCQVYLWSVPQSLPAILQKGDISQLHSPDKLIYLDWALGFVIVVSSFHHGAGRNWWPEKNHCQEKVQNSGADFFLGPQVQRHFFLFSLQRQTHGSAWKSW